MELNYTKDGKYKVMVGFENNHVAIFNRFNTREEAEYIIDLYTNPTRMVDFFVNAGAEYWLEIEE